jgi:hypothetical protein
MEKPTLLKYFKRALKSICSIDFAFIGGRNALFRIDALNYYFAVLFFDFLQQLILDKMSFFFIG